MSDKTLDETELTIEADPPTADEIVGTVITEIVSDTSPDETADEIVEEFFLQERPETPQILMMLEQPTDYLVDILKQLVTEGYGVQIQALDTRGAAYLDNLKSAVKTKLTELASEEEAS